MIYAKIFMDGDYLVFESVKEPVEYQVYIAGDYLNWRGETMHDDYNSVSPTTQVAISKEAKEAIGKLYSYLNPNFVAAFFEGDVKITYGPRGPEDLRGRISFIPEEGTSRLRVNIHGKATLCYQNGFDMRALDYMKIYDNEFLKALDISVPFDDVAFENRNDQQGVKGRR